MLGMHMKGLRNPPALLPDLIAPGWLVLGQYIMYASYKCVADHVVRHNSYIGCIYAELSVATTGWSYMKLSASMIIPSGAVRTYPPISTCGS